MMPQQTASLNQAISACLRIKCCVTLQDHDRNGEIRMSIKLTIEIEYVNPTIPLRRFDYRASIQGVEDGPEGWGETPTDAAWSMFNFKNLSSIEFHINKINARED